MNDKSDKSNNRIVVLQNVTLKASSVNFSSEGKNDCYRDNLICDDKENDSVICNTKRRFTASSYIFDEEPLFSDSDEEKEHYKYILASQKCFIEKYKTSKILEEAVSTLSEEDLKIISIIKECANINIENIKDDFKPFLKICKDLQVKYRHVEIIPAKTVTVHNGVPNKEASSITDISKRDLLVLPQERVCDGKLTPSRSGNSGKNGGFSSQTFSFDSGFSSDMQELFNRHTSGICIADKKRKSLKHSQSDIKLENVRIKKRNFREINKNVLKQIKLVKAVRKGTNKKKHTKLKKGHKKNFRYDLFYMKAKPLPREQLRVLARSWMNPNKAILNNLSDGESVNQKPKIRKLYSSHMWQHTTEFLSQRIE